ncbi:elongation of fatty acids protein 3-like [Chenopodium quinoa]|uniref:elongation of fatty acids protein 3-like n=1 Tax=Chenopodium quinoa TaxID=63459 RepID=UPI000B77B0BF|nr:elongation of fatty acids protein 3-like [Chenopodium quinoa]
MQNLKYYLSQHPTITNFRWSPTQTWFSTWYFLVITLTSYTILSFFLHHTLTFLLPNRRGFYIPLGPIPAIHNLLVSLLSITIFIGTLLSTTAEIHDNTRWLWRSTHLRTTPVKWLLCFPPGTRPTGRVFFWSYTLYLSRLFLHLPQTFLKILKRRHVTFFHVLNQSSLLLMSYLWLEFSQSFQVLAILLLTLLYGVVYGYRFCVVVGFPKPRFLFLVNCLVVLLVCNLICHVGVLLLHFFGGNKGGCNGIGAWLFNSVCNGLIFLVFFKDFK